MRYKTCPLCGAHLDPAEHCRCDEEQHHDPDLEEAYPHSLPAQKPITRKEYYAKEMAQRYRRVLLQ